YDPSFRGGVNVASAGLDIVTAPGPGGPPLVRRFIGVGGIYSMVPPQEFMAYDPRFLGGVNVGISPNGIVTGPGPGGGPHVRLWTASFPAPQMAGEFFAFDPAFRGGVFVG